MLRRMLLFSAMMLFFANCKNLKAVKPELKPDARPAVLSLNTWKFREAGTEQWRDLDVPGCVHLGLLKNNLIEDPFFGDNEKRLQWIETKDWEFTTTFDVDDNVLSNSHVLLDFEGLDTYADVYLNDKLLLKADNMFRHWEVECKRQLLPRNNVLRVYFHAAVAMDEQKSKSLAYELPGGKRVFSRKAQYHYGWDWGPRFVTCGIWRPVTLRAWNKANINDLQVRQLSLTDSVANMQAVLTIESATRFNAAIGVSADSQLVSRQVALDAGTNTVVVDFKIQNPKRWWSRGLGAQHRYAIQAAVGDDAQLCDTMTVRTGLRTIELVTENDSKGQTFYFKLNGVPVFMKGANYIPLESFYGRVSDKTYRELLTQAADANMNMLRVWGGGVYENDAFYDLCDEMGILVWQDFMFACAMYPGDQQFLRNVELEAVENIKRLRNHPCVALWCGNNEISEAWDRWGWREGFKKNVQEEIWGSYQKLFVDLLPKLVFKHANGVPYWESSPRFGRGNPQHQFEGDAHYWGVWHDAEPFEAFEQKVPRFMSEFGFQAFPSMATIERYAKPEDRKIDSEAMLNHQKHPRGNMLVTEYMMRDYRKPKDFDAFVYVSQLLQAEGMRKGIDAHRRSMPYCMGTLYWQLNDCWPVISWSGMDYYLRWKAMHYFVRESYADVMLSVSTDATKMKVHLVNDRLKPFSGRLEVKLFDFTGRPLYEDLTLPNVGANSSDLVYQCDPDVILKERQLQAGEVFFLVSLLQNDTVIAQRTYYSVPPRSLNLPEVTIQREIVPSPEGCRIRLTCDRLAKNVYLESTIEGHFSDNFFDLLPGIPREVVFRSGEKSLFSPDAFRIRSLVDTYR